MIVEPEIGKRYFVATKSGSRIRGRYIGTDYANRFLFDLRPESGTTTIDRDDVRILEPTTKKGFGHA